MRTSTKLLYLILVVGTLTLLSVAVIKSANAQQLPPEPVQALYQDYTAAATMQQHVAQGIQALVAAYQAAQARVNELEAENKKLKEAIPKIDDHSNPDTVQPSAEETK